jgi:hypothetical protein
MATNGNHPDQNNPFNPASLRLDQSFVESAGVKKQLTTVPVRRPNPQDWVRVRPEPEFRLNAAIIELRDERGEVYIVKPDIAKQLVGEFVAATLFTGMTRQEVTFIWPVKLPGPDGKHNLWHASAAEAAGTAMSRWVRVKSNMNLGAYEIFQSISELPEPVWPDLTLDEILKVAFRGRLVDTLEHPVIRRLKGAT